MLNLQVFMKAITNMIYPWFLSGGDTETCNNVWNELIVKHVFCGVGGTFSLRHVTGRRLQMDLSSKTTETIWLGWESKLFRVELY